MLTCTGCEGATYTPINTKNDKKYETEKQNKYNNRNPEMRQASGGGCVCRLDTFFGALLFSIFSRQHSFLLCYFEVLLLDV